MIASALEKKLTRAGFNTFVAYDMNKVQFYIEEDFVEFFAVILEIDLKGDLSKDRVVKYMTTRRIATIVLSSFYDSSFMEKMLRSFLKT